MHAPIPLLPLRSLRLQQGQPQNTKGAAGEIYSELSDESTVKYNLSSVGLYNEALQGGRLCAAHRRALGRAGFVKKVRGLFVKGVLRCRFTYNIKY